MLAQFLRRAGHAVSGSDIKDVFMTDRVLGATKIKVLSPFSPKNIPTNLDLIIYSSAYTPDNNSELAFIKVNPDRFKNVRILSYAAALGAVFNKYYGVAVCGSHGKTTVSAWLGYVLWRAKKNPNVLVGSRVPQFKGSSLHGESKYFVAEVDEYQNKLQYFKPQGVVLNNIDYDHPDFFKTPAAYTKVFSDFVKKIPRAGWLVINNSDSNTAKIKKVCSGKIISYDLMTSGREGKEVRGADYYALNLKLKNADQFFTVIHKGKNLGEFKISLWGEHNVLNALAVIAAARILKVPLSVIKKQLAGFKGTERRAQVLGSYHGALIVDDYAHHPTEIKATLNGLRGHYQNKKLIVVFHPHTFTRTKALFKDFVSSFATADELIILDIYGSAREKQGGVSSAELAKAINTYNHKKQIKQSVKNIATIPQVATYLKKALKSGDLLLLMGAGDVFRLAEKLL